MGYWDTLIQNNPFQQYPLGGYRSGQPFANTWPLYEIQSPQYPAPGVYNLMRQGYKLNELVYACIERLAWAVSEGKTRVMLDHGEDGTLEEIKDHPLRKLLRKPNPRMSEADFWRAKEIYCGIAGFSPWEIEFSNGGEPIALWPMRPDWCSFLRGDGQPFRAIRYQPYGLPPVDVPSEQIMMFQYFDPEFPMLKSVSPTAIALREMGVDNNATDFLKLFFQRGTKMSGILKTEQKLQQAEADLIRSNWRNTHGGVENWGDVAVLGYGTEYQSIQMNFRDMEFPELDARSEARICMIFKVPPILLGAKIGLDRSTFANYGEAKSAFYEYPIGPTWNYGAGALQSQLLPHFEEHPDQFEVEIDTRNVGALQEDRSAMFTRATQAAAANLLTRDEAREEMGYDPIDNAPVWVGGAALFGDPTATVPSGETGDDVLIDDDQEDDGDPNDPEAAAIALEEKQFKAFARRRIRERKLADVKNFKFRYVPPAERGRLLAEVLPAKADPFQDYEGAEADD